jgi:hypothetical protein
LHGMCWCHFLTWFHYSLLRCHFSSALIALHVLGTTDSDAVLLFSKVFFGSLGSRLCA